MQKKELEMKDLSEYTEEELKKEIERRKKVKAFPKEFDDIYFQPLISEIRAMVQRIEESGCTSKNDKQWIFEAAIECMYPKEKFWNWFNKYVV